MWGAKSVREKVSEIQVSTGKQPISRLALASDKLSTWDFGWWLACIQCDTQAWHCVSGYSFVFRGNAAAFNPVNGSLQVSHRPRIHA